MIHKFPLSTGPDNSPRAEAEIVWQKAKDLKHHFFIVAKDKDGDYHFESVDAPHRTFADILREQVAHHATEGGRLVNIYKLSDPRPHCFF